MSGWLFKKIISIVIYNVCDTAPESIHLLSASHFRAKLKKIYIYIFNNLFAVIHSLAQVL